MSYSNKRGHGKNGKKANPTITLTGMPPQAQQTWWSQRFIKVLESFKLGGRLARGKAYAQEAKVLKINISSGLVTASVQGSRKSSYRISIKFDPLPDHTWKLILHNMTKRAIYAAEMLLDRMPTDIESVFSYAGASLFPERLEDLKSECDCPDWSNPCKHIAATYYVLAQHFDLDPFLIFVWRGRLKTQILEALRQTWKQGRPKSGPLAAPRESLTPEALDFFWHGVDRNDYAAPLDPYSKAVPDTAIKNLGPAPLELNGRDLGSILAECYNEVSEGIREWSRETYRDRTLATAAGSHHS
ncbi:MAG: SWIM zinc finger family protein [Planctomycetes bacterium]|nr:SWIM zinc finger family protein [Planctomycetota bacterium]MCB1042959.1 SWIM zinc finger family protein [Acidobacteriota bacterium]